MCVLSGTSLIIHNSGLPAATLISFIWCLGGMCVAWIIVKVRNTHAAQLHPQRVSARHSGAAIAAITCCHVTAITVRLLKACLPWASQECLWDVNPDQAILG